MASDKPLKFDWGDPVKLINEAIDFYGIYQGSVCGFRTVDNIEIAQRLNVPLGTVLVLVEGNDGKTIEIPESKLTLLS